MADRSEVRDIFKPIIERARDLATPGITHSRTSGAATSSGASATPATRRDSQGRSIRPMFWGLDDWNDPNVQWADTGAILPE